MDNITFQEREITIGKEEYDSLMLDSHYLSMLIDLFFDNCELAWDKQRLDCSSKIIGDFIALRYKATYMENLKLLQEAENE